MGYASSTTLRSERYSKSLKIQSLEDENVDQTNNRMENISAGVTKDVLWEENQQTLRRVEPRGRNEKKGDNLSCSSKVRARSEQAKQRIRVQGKEREVKRSAREDKRH